MGKNNSCVYERGDFLFIGNERIELGFNKSDGGSLASILDKKTNFQLLHNRNAPRYLYRLALRLEDNNIEWLSNLDAGRFEWRKEEGEGGTILILETAQFPDRALKVIIRIMLEDGSSLTRWRMEVQDVEQTTVHQLTCPVISGLFKIGEPIPGEALAIPRHGEGYLFKNPFPVYDRLPLCAGAGLDVPDVGIGELHGFYPGSMSMQLLIYYNHQSGIYLATHDAEQNVKSFDMGPWDDEKECPILSISHFPSEMRGKDISFAYDTVLGVFQGNWCDAADIYKAWARKQWWCKKKLWERDIPDWMRRGFGVFQMSNYHIPLIKMNHSLSQIAGLVNKLSGEAGVPLLSLIFNWENRGGWTAPVGLFPPREGEDKFKKAMYRLRQAGNHGFVYIPGGCWYLKLPYQPPFNSWPEFEAEGKPYAVKNVHGEIDIHRWLPGWEVARLCPHTDYARKLTVSMVLQCLELGCSVVQIDNFPCGGSEACYDSSHGHPLGHGAWWSRAWAEILAEVRRQARSKNPQCAITSEGISENFIPYLDMFDQRAGNMEYFGHYRRGDPMGGETIPLFTYVYNEYIGAYCAAYPECNRPEVLYWTRCLGKSLAQGVVPTGGWYFPEPAELNPVTITFYKKVVRAAAQECWPYLMFGEMLKPPEIDVPIITASYCKMTPDADHMDPRNRHEVQDQAIQHSVWRGRDGTIGYFLINISESPVSFELELSAYGMEAEKYDVEHFIDGVGERWLAAVTLPRRERIDMTPLSVILIVVRRH